MAAPRLILLATALAAFLAAGLGARAQTEPPAAAEPSVEAAPAPQPVVTPPAPVAVQSLTVLDMFSAGTGPGLGPDLWKESSAELARTVLPILAAKPLSPQLAALARRVLATSAPGPEGMGNDPDLAAARALALIAQGDAAGADAILAQTNGVAASAALSQAAAEAALLLGQDDKACAIGQALTAGRDGVYWLRLRGYCQAKAGETAAAQLTVDLADAQARDPVYRRFMTVVLAGSGDPGKASLRNGLDLVLSRRLGLDLAGAPRPGPAVAALLSPPPVFPAGAPWLQVSALAAEGKLPEARALRGGLERNDAAGLTAVEMTLLDAILSVGGGQAEEAVMAQLVDRAGQGDVKARPRAQAAAVIYQALGPAMSPGVRAEFARLDLGRATAPPARTIALQRASVARAKADTALLVLWIGAEAGASGPGPLDRAAVVAALNQAGLAADARAVALEGLMALQTPAAPAS